MNTSANANLFSRLFDGLDDPSKLAIEQLDGSRISYADLIGRAGQIGERAGGARGQAGRPCRGASRKVGLGPRALSRHRARRRGLFAAQHRLYADRARLLLRRCRAIAGGLRSANADGIGSIAAKVGARVETLGAEGKGSLTEAAAKAIT